ncbi:MAG TPA: XdhC family protein, partial [Candidatus Eremiobacteraceae bacterium]|nr:XdhC family protein [Candidatus Eremiobacteraceae bacterium]
TESGLVEGSVSGGCVESDVAARAQDVLASGKSAIERYGINRDMMWDVGLSCGGTIDVYIESLAAGRQPVFEDGVVLCTIVRGPDRVGERFLVRNSGGTLRLEGDAGPLAADLRDAATEALRSAAPSLESIGRYSVFVDPQVPAPQLVIIGAVHIAMHLCEMAARCGFEPMVIDPRPALNSQERFPSARRRIVGWPEDELPKLTIDANTYVAVLTHAEKFDDPSLAYVLPRDARYVGAIGSRKTQAKRRERLRAAGMAPEFVERLHGPIGLDLGAQTPQEIAVSILAEMVAAKYGRSGTPMSAQAHAAT